MVAHLVYKMLVYILPNQQHTNNTSQFTRFPAHFHHRARANEQTFFMCWKLNDVAIMAHPSSRNMKPPDTPGYLIRYEQSSKPSTRNDWIVTCCYFQLVWSGTTTHRAQGCFLWMEICDWLITKPQLVGQYQKVTSAEKSLGRSMVILYIQGTMGPKIIRICSSTQMAI